MSGSEGGLEHAGKMVRYLYDNGIPAMALGYFKTKNTGRTLEWIPLEIIERAVAWLKKQGYEKSGIEGVSKGAEYALVAATEISCVIIKTPSWFYNEGIKRGKAFGISC